MLYYEWCIELGKYRWRTKEDIPRTYYPLPGNYGIIYDCVCGFADLEFSMREVPEPLDVFYTHFLTTVPDAWIRWKTQIELLIGTLDGLNIDPDIFEAGFTRTRTLAGTRDEKEYSQGLGSNKSYSGAGSASSTSQDANNAQSASKTRTMLYNQGAQAYPNLTEGNIGSLGNDYLSTLQDTIGNSNTQGSEGSSQTKTSPQASSSVYDNVGLGSRESGHEFGEIEKIHETRVNYYDNLAFLRERADHLSSYKDFGDYFLPLFTQVTGFELPYTKGAWC